MRSPEQLIAVGKLRGKAIAQLGAHFIAAAVDARPDGGDHVFGFNAKMLAHGARAFFDDSRQRATPAGVKRPDRATLTIGNQHRNAIGRLDAQQHPRAVRDQPIAGQLLSRNLLDEVNHV